MTTWNSQPTKPQPLAVATLYLLAALAMWDPGPEESLSIGPQQLVRYGLFSAASLIVVLQASLKGTLRISLAPDGLLPAAFLLYTALSSLWSEGGFSAAVKGLLIAQMLFVSIGIGGLLRLDRILRIFFNAMGIFVLVSLAVVFLAPGMGVQTGWRLEGDWRGIAGQKNGLGSISGLVTVAALALPLSRRADGRLAAARLAGRGATLAAALLCLVNSGSRGALLGTGIGVGSLLVARLPRAVQHLGLVLLVVLSIPLLNLALATIEVSADKIGVLGATIDTNSRTTLWFYGLEALKERPLLGFGVGGFWTPERLTAFKDTHGWVLDNFHNGYVTVLIEEGAVGLALLLTAVAFVSVLLLVAIGYRRDPHLSLAFAFTNMFLVANMVENEVGRSTSLRLLLFLAVTFALRPFLRGPIGRRGARSRAAGAAAGIA